MSGAHRKLYEEYVDDVYGYLAYRHGSRAVTEQLTRKTFERAFRDGQAIRDPRGPLVALLTIARQAIPQSAGATTQTDELVIPPDLAGALYGVDRGERAVLALRFGAGLRGPEIGAVLDISERRVRQLLSRGLRRVRTELERQRGGSGEQGEP